MTAENQTPPNKIWMLKATGQAGLRTTLERSFRLRGTSDEFDAFVVRAPDESTARALAAQWDGDEGSDMWLDPFNSTCREIEPDGDPMVLLSSLRQ